MTSLIVELMQKLIMRDRNPSFIIILIPVEFFVFVVILGVYLYLMVRYKEKMTTLIIELVQESKKNDR